MMMMRIVKEFLYLACQHLQKKMLYVERGMFSILKYFVSSYFSPWPAYTFCFNTAVLNYYHCVVCMECASME